MFTLHQLRVFWTLAHSPSLTQAAKQLGISQPSLSQQLAKLERAVGTRLFVRGAGRLEPTDAGRFLLEHAGELIADVERLEAGLAAFREGRRGRVAVGALASVGRTLVPEALRRARQQVPGLEVDLHELAPRDALEQLYGRSLQIALLSETAVARDHLDFARTPLCADGYVLAVPRGLRLAGVTDPGRDLGAKELRQLRRVIQFNFGTLHQQRVEAWYRRALGRFETVARTRQYESALAMVEAGLGVALVPLFATQLAGRPLFAVDLYAVPGLERRIVALYPSHYHHLEPFRTLLAALAETASALRVREPLPPPPWLAARQAADAAEPTAGREAPAP